MNTDFPQIGTKHRIVRAEQRQRCPGAAITVKNKVKNAQPALRSNVLLGACLNDYVAAKIFLVP